MIIIGSEAAKAHIPGWREPADRDLIVSVHESQVLLEETDWPYSLRNQGRKAIVHMDRPIEMEIYEPGDGSSAEQLDNLYSDGGTFCYAPLEALLLLKLSHRYLKDSPHFWKTMSDVQALRRALGREDVPDDLKGLLKLREKETYPYVHPNLDRSKEDFFADDSIEYIYDHDSLHVAVAVEHHSPAYIQYLRPGADVAVDMDRFFELPDDVRLNGVVEEAAVLTLERSLIPFYLRKGDPTEGGARRIQDYMFRFALAKVCSSITSGRFREYAWENAYRAMARYAMVFGPGDTLVDRFLRDRSNGTIVEL